MKTWLVGCLVLLLSITAFGDTDPKAVVEPLHMRARPSITMYRSFSGSVDRRGAGDSDF